MITYSPPLGYVLIIPRSHLDHALVMLWLCLKEPFLPASRRDHRNGKRPCGARLWGQDGQRHKKPTRGMYLSNYSIWKNTFIIVIFFDNVFVHFRLFPNLQISFWQSRELKPDLISPPHTLTSTIPGFQFYIFSKRNTFLISFGVTETSKFIFHGWKWILCLWTLSNQSFEPKIKVAKDKIC